jgi:cysteinyl-tRNA synthetase
LRYLLASVPYRKKLNFTFDGLKAAATSIDRLRNYRLRLETDKFPRRDQRGNWLSAPRRCRTRSQPRSTTISTPPKRWGRFSNTSATPIPPWTRVSFPAGNVTGALEFLARFDSVFDVLKPTAHAGGLADAEVDALIAERNHRQEST